MTREEIIEKVNGFLIDEFEIEETRISPDANFKDDLELESLDFVDIVVIIERDFGFKVKSEELVHIRQLSDLYNYIEEQVKNKN
ncbi:MAG TPA: phosphopantetheine-binding protein [Draconibacterium sp.]|nr:phosphopantetheine-binding protein [Draconibacterium sp.]HRX12381.1 phosphopantetheine-binding protein [Draconibacterium sp.]